MSGEAAVSAPGKTILMGEHAAVYGHPALVAAIDLRLTVTAGLRPEGNLHLSIPALGFDGSRDWDAVLALLADGEGPVREAHDLAFVAAGEALRHAGGADREGLTVAIESSLPSGAGLGSSAALAVAVVAATLAAKGAPHDNDTVARLALAVETRQHGRPSGVDVQAVLRGGVLWCQRGRGGGLLCTPTALPEPARRAIRLFHSGAPGESTGAMVASVRALKEARPDLVDEAMAAIDRATRESRALLSDGDAADVVPGLIPLVRTAEAALETLGVVPPPVAAAIRAVEASGGAAKISGAGGRTGGAGLVLVVGPSAGPPPERLVPESWTPIRTQLGAPGLREEVAA